MDQLPTILGALILAGILWIMRTTTETQRDVAVLRQAAETDRAELDRVRVRIHETNSKVQGMAGARELAEEIVDALDQRVMRLGAHREAT